jgi:hypothetical protein
MPGCQRSIRGIAVVVPLVLASCGGGDDGGGLAGTQSPILIVAADDADPLRERIVDTLERYAGQVSGLAPAVVRESPPSSLPAITRSAAAARAGLVFVLDAETLLPDRVPAAEIAALPEGGFRIASEEVGDFANSLDDGSTGATVVLLAGASKLGRQYAVYEAIRRLGVRYYHPEEEYVPRVPRRQLRRRAARPTIVARRSGGEVSVDYTPDFRFRGYTFHGSHPLENLESFSDGDFPIGEAERVNEWIVKNRGETFRGAGRGVAPEEARARRAAELEDLRQLLGMTRGTGITLHNVQQGGRPEIDPMSPVPVREQIETLVEERLAATPDATQFGIHFGPTEVSVTPDVETVQWIDWAGQKALELRPDIPVIINDHTSGGQAVDHFDDLGCPPGTNDRGVCDYYDLAFHTDPRIGVSVHTVMFYPLEGPVPVYNQVTFAHKLCLMQRGSAEGRPLEWFPESSWWLSFDNPIPVYLPLHLETRHRDVQRVAPLLENRGGTLRRHKEFNSGHEWGYWQQDYGVGLWHWNVEVPFDDVLRELMDPLCKPEVWPQSCPAREAAVRILGELIRHQKNFFLERTDYAGLPGGLYSYFAGEDPADELAARAGFVFRPVRVSFAEVAAFPQPTADRFRHTDVAALHEADAAHANWLSQLREIEPIVPEAGRPWLAEVIDGIEINGLRARHVAALYEAILAFRAARLAGDADPASAAEPFLAAARAVVGEAETVIRRREAFYRYPPEQVYGGGLTAETAVPNGTTYPYRVHTKTHLLTYWHNRQASAEGFVAGGTEDEDRVVMTPVFAAPGTPLGIEWPASPGLVASVDLGDGTIVDPSITEHVYTTPGIFAVSGTLELEGIPITVGGAIARTDLRAAAPLGGFTLTVPDDPVAVEFIRGITPAFELAADGGRFASATDVTGAGSFHFTDVVLAALTTDAGGGFETSAADTRLQLVGLTGPQGDPRFIRLSDVTFLGTLGPAGFGDTVTIDGRIVIGDVVALLVELIGFDEQGARAFLAGVYEVPVENLGEEAPFRGELAVEAPGG